MTLPYLLGVFYARTISGKDHSVIFVNSLRVSCEFLRTVLHAHFTQLTSEEVFVVIFVLCASKPAIAFPFRLGRSFTESAFI